MRIVGYERGIRKAGYKTEVRIVGDEQGLRIAGYKRGLEWQSIKGR